MSEQHCGTCSCGTVEYGVTFIGGAREGETFAPLEMENLCYWFRHSFFTARLVIRTRPETKWRRADNDEVRAWNLMIAQHIGGVA